ncbi:MAG TPA: hypothetical protein DDX40_06165 [Rikenellaceae bacterium]|nr:hypothetical protein [Rikenellaceae bacterium]
MNTNNEFQLIWEYNLLRTFVRHVFMATCDPYGKLNIRNLKYIYGDGKAKDKDCEPSVSFILNNAIGIMKEEDPNDGKKEVAKEILPCMFLKGMVNYSDQDSEGTIFKEYAGANNLGKFVAELPEIRTVCELDENIDKVIDFILLIKSHELSSLGKYNICGHSILTIAAHLLNLMKESGYAVKSDFKLPESDPQKVLDTLPKPNREIVEVNKYLHRGSKQANKKPHDITTDTHGCVWYTDNKGLRHKWMHHGFDLSDMSETDYTDTFSDMDEEARETYQINQLFTLILDTDEYFVRGVIVPMMAAYIGCDQLFELKQDKNADVHLNRLYDLVKEQIDVNDHKSVLDYMSKEKFMISALLPNE